MGSDDTEEFVRRIKEDAAFREHVLDSADPETRLAVAREHGYDITAAGLGEYAGRLRDDHLEGVVAATCPDACSKRIEPA